MTGGVPLSRRGLLAGLAALAALPGTARGGLLGPGVPFSADALRAHARALSRAPHRPVPEVPQGWRDLTYDQYRKIWFKPDRAILSDTDGALWLDLFVAGLFYPRAVQIAVVENGQARGLAFDPALFDRTDKFPDPPVDQTMGYSGVRLRAQLNRPGVFEEFLVFQGASYFRAIGNGQVYGLSARGLALNTAAPEGEEFPDFTHLYVEAAAPDAQVFVVHALLDGPSATGAYRFAITPGRPTRVEVEAALYPRVALSHVGLAPLTSMFLFDETNRHRFDDFRPAVHDSEALMIWNGAGEVLWRPLSNPRALQVSSFADTSPRGFGLIQRGRRAEDFADLEAHYHLRPSLWITPRGDWGPGAVDLVEIPTRLEVYDNVVAYWRPRAPLAAGAEHRVAYAMAWGDDPLGLPDLARVANTRIGAGFDGAGIVCTVDFAAHPALAGGPEALRLHVSAHRGAVGPGILQRNPGTGGLRAAFTLTPGDAPLVELRAQITRDGVPVSEVWLYRWTA